MEKEQAIAMIPYLEGKRGKGEYIRASDFDGNKLMFPRRTTLEKTLLIKDVNGQDETITIRLKDVMVNLIESADRVEGFDGGFGLLLNTIYWDENKQSAQKKKDWIYFRVGEIEEDEEDRETDEREQAARKNDRIIEGRFKELERQARQASTDNKKAEVTEDRQPANNDNNIAQLPEIASQLPTETNRLSAELVDEFLSQYNFNREKCFDYKKRLLYLVEFSILNQDWDRETAIRGYYNFLINKGFSKVQIKDICSPVSRFYDWLKEKGIIEYNPIKVLKWRKRENVRD